MVKSIDSETYSVERNDFPGVKSNILRTDLFLDSDLRRLKEMNVS